MRINDNKYQISYIRLTYAMALYFVEIAHEVGATIESVVLQNKYNEDIRYTDPIINPKYIDNYYLELIVSHHKKVYLDFVEYLLSEHISKMKYFEHCYTKVNLERTTYL